MSAAPRSVVFGCAGHRLSTGEKRFFAQAQPWGAILFARNIDTPEQLRALTADWRDAIGRDLPILIDQEGGRVQRMGRPHWRAWLPALDQCQRATDPERAMYLRGRLIADDLLRVGINVNCAPLADIARDQTHAILRNRCYGTDLADVVAHARAMAQGLMAGGVLPVVKHIPGHGRATLDSHVALPVVDTAAETLRKEDFAAFQALADLPLGMSAHILFTAFDADEPATTSPRIQNLIREEIGFDGALMTDDLSMRALAGSPAARARAALGAGCDLVLHCNGALNEMQDVAPECPPLSGKSLERCDAALACRQLPDKADIAAMEHEYRQLVPEGAV